MKRHCQKYWEVSDELRKLSQKSLTIRKKCELKVCISTMETIILPNVGIENVKWEKCYGYRVTGDGLFDKYESWNIVKLKECVTVNKWLSREMCTTRISFNDVSWYFCRFKKIFLTLQWNRGAWWRFIWIYKGAPERIGACADDKCNLNWIKWEFWGLGFCLGK